MDELKGRKRRRKSRRDREKIPRERYHTEKSPPRASATKLIRCVNKTQKLYEKHSSNQNITHGRMTIRPGLFNQGKCTSFVYRALNLSPEKKARMDEDLHRIIQLANDGPIHHPSRSENIRNQKDELTNYNKNLKEPVVHELMDICEDSHSREIPFLDKNMNSKKHELNHSLVVNHHSNLDHGKLEKKENNLSGGRFHKPLPTLSSSSSSSNDSANFLPLELINYSDPPMETYEKFADSIVSALNSKQGYLFPHRDYLQEVRSALKIKYNISQEDSEIYHVDSEGIWEEEVNDKDGSKSINGLWSREQNASLPVMVDQAVGTSARIQPMYTQEIISREYSPVALTLSPKTTILNPIEYLKRVEKTTKQVERHSSDSGIETNLSHDSNISNSQSKSCKSCPGSQDNWNSLNYLLNINSRNMLPSEVANQKLIYQHSNRGYIDSPQAVEFKEANFIASHCQQQSMTNNHLRKQLDSLYGNLVDPLRPSMSQRMISDVEIDSNQLGFEYLMDVSDIAEANGNASDLLDDLDASDCNLITDTNVICTDAIGRKSTLNKWGPPPSPDTPDHKYYRRKMF